MNKNLTQYCLKQITAIKGAINLGLSQKLINSFSFIKPITKPEYTVSKAKLNPY